MIDRGNMDKFKLHDLRNIHEFGITELSVILW